MKRFDYFSYKMPAIMYVKKMVSCLRKMKIALRTKYTVVVITVNFGKGIEYEIDKKETKDVTQKLIINTELYNIAKANSGLLFGHIFI